MEIIAFIVTVVVGFIVDSLIISIENINWPSGGTIVAIATMGIFILWEVRHKKDK